MIIDEYVNSVRASASTIQTYCTRITETMSTLHDLESDEVKDMEIFIETVKQDIRNTWHFIKQLKSILMDNEYELDKWFIKNRLNLISQAQDDIRRCIPILNSYQEHILDMF